MSGELKRGHGDLGLDCLSFLTSVWKCLPNWWKVANFEFESQLLTRQIKVVHNTFSISIFMMILGRIPEQTFHSHRGRPEEDKVRVAVAWGLGHFTLGTHWLQ